MIADQIKDIRQSVTPSTKCAGNIKSEQSWQLLSADRESVLVDVRTLPEWTFVGIPDLSSVGKEALKLSWRIYPAMDINPVFTRKLSNDIKDKEKNILFICRSGGRSLEAAEAMTSLGYKNCFNISDGFEGSVDSAGHRGNVDGWKAANLPWVQV